MASSEATGSQSGVWYRIPITFGQEIVHYRAGSAHSFLYMSRSRGYERINSAVDGGIRSVRIRPINGTPDQARRLI